MLNSKQQAALDVLLGGGTGVEAAKAAGVTPQLISRWKTFPDFVKALSARRDDILHDIGAQLGPLLPLATKALKDCLTTGPGNVRVRAAGMVIEQLRAVTQEAQMAERIAELEELVRELSEGPARPTPEAGSDPEVLESIGTNGSSAALPGPDVCDAGGWSNR